MYLSLLERHVLDLDPDALRPATKALILSLLPGLEEESSDDFERILGDIDKLRAAISGSYVGSKDDSSGHGASFFWQSLFLASIWSDSRRPGALAYLKKRLPQLGPMTANGSVESGINHQEAKKSNLPAYAEAVVSPEPGLLVRCFASGLCDKQTLLQRGYLDLLLSHLPLNSPVLVESIDKGELQRLVTAAMNVVVRRDMSLNRRLWAWFLGPDASDEDDDGIQPVTPTSPIDGVFHETQSASALYFKQYGIEPLSASILAMFNPWETRPIEKVKPFRICLSLMDRWEVGGPLVPRIFLPAMQDLLTYRAKSSEKDFQDVLRSAGGFFDGIESGIIWGQLQDLVVSALHSAQQAPDSRVSKLELAEMIFSCFNVREEEMMTFHMPLTCLSILNLVHQRESVSKFHNIGCGPEVLQRALRVAEELLLYMPEREHLNASFGGSAPPSMESLSKSIDRIVQQRITAFYTDSSGNLSASPPPFSSQITADLLLKYAVTIFCSALESAHGPQSIESRAKVLTKFVNKFPTCDILDLARLVRAFQNALEACHEDSLLKRFQVSMSIHQVLLAILSKATEPQAPSEDLSRLFSELIDQFWSFLTPSSPKYHVESVRCLMQIDGIYEDEHILEASIARFVHRSLNSPERSDSAEPARRFVVFWTHTMQHAALPGKRMMSRSRRTSLVSSTQPAADVNESKNALSRPMLLLLEGLDNEGTELYNFLTAWLKGIADIDKIILSLVDRITEIQNHNRTNIQQADDPLFHTLIRNRDRTEEALYFLQILLNILRLSSSNVQTTLTSRMSLDTSRDEEGFQEASLQVVVARLCLQFLQQRPKPLEPSSEVLLAKLDQMSLKVMRQLLENPDLSSLQAFTFEEPLVDVLLANLDNNIREPSVVIALIDVTLAYIKLKFIPPRTTRSRKSSSLDAIRSLAGRVEGAGVLDPRSNGSSQSRLPPKRLLQCIQSYIGSPNSLETLEHWVQFLIEVFPLYSSSLFQKMIPLVGTFYRQINDLLSRLQSTFSQAPEREGSVPDIGVFSLFTGLEHIIMAAQSQLSAEESSETTSKPSDPSTGLFSGVFSTETQKGRSSTANSRLTVILCLQDTVRICFSVWSWASYGQESDSHDNTSAYSFSFVSSRLRSRARRLLDRMFAAEALECLETLILEWKQHPQEGDNQASYRHPVINLIHVLEASRPKLTMPALFNAIYSRTNPQALDVGRRSTLTSDVRELELAEFLIEYTKSLDDDAMDEIWADCMTFLKDVLTNSISHGPVLPALLLFLLTLAEKVENTNFGEQRKMRKELNDLFSRLLTATFTSKPAAAFLERPSSRVGIDGEVPNRLPRNEKDILALPVRQSSVVDILVLILPRLQTVLSEQDRLVGAASVISTNVFGPIIHSKRFFENLQLNWLILLQKVMRIPNAIKAWRKDVSELFNHSKLFSLDTLLVNEGLLGVLKQWATTDKDRVPEFLGRIASPTSAGLMFGVGASAARLDADKKTQLNLRRAAVLILAMDTDAIVSSISAIEEKIVDILNATAASSPSSVTRAEIFLLLRTMTLKTSAIHLAPLWPMVAAELQKALRSAVPQAKNYDTYNVPSLLQACKLLDLLLLLGPDDFQMHEWLFITDTIDAVYRPGHWDPVALVDEIVEDYGNTSQEPPPSPGLQNSSPTQESFGSQGPVKRTGTSGLELRGEAIAEISKGEFVKKTVIPFYSRLSLHHFEAVYSMSEVDLDGCKKELIEDIFDDKTIVG